MDSDDNMQNATLISNLPPPMSSSMGFSTPTQNTESKGTQEVSSYMDLIKDLDINKLKNQQQQQQQMPQQQMQQIAPAAPKNIMQTMQTESSSYMGGMPQSAPISASQNVQGMAVQQSPLISNLLPDPMFFQPPPPPLKERRVKPIVKIEEPVKKTPFNFDMVKVKPAILVAVIVFALLSWGAPMIARRVTWTVDSITGKFTPSGLIVLSILTGGIFLGVTEIVRNYGSGI
ncbi:hypothetical protein PBCVAN69C_474L [Paramecium bursaria Chlorella virus AN69C]|uniref:Uncharacterized protein n=1 Tax=Paramecium bursaria Chlorella virus IL3A TaxID=46019 RepID=M1HUQ8_PBCVI|nr:hypothetical protein PBCVAN69C_474L [Paramecium bursaria Chlorella virus AN69C]AGE53924.1 hypothetical protein PBCVIL3A_467L [Paramecium bursaria Chlorella virus IL3A]